MFCPFCGQPDGVPGLKCVRCGEDLPRSKGGTVIVEEQARAAAAPTTPGKAAQPEIAPGELQIATPADLATTFASAGVRQAPVIREQPFVPHVSERAFSHPGSDPSESVLPEPLPTPRPVAAQPPAPGAPVGHRTGQNIAPYAPTRPSLEADNLASLVANGGLPPPQLASVVTPPATGDARGGPAPSESPTGLVLRAVCGAVSLISGAVPLAVAALLLPAWFAGMHVLDAPRYAPGMLALAAALIATFELMAGIRMLAGGRLPHASYALSFVVQFSASIGGLLLISWDRYLGRFHLVEEVSITAAILVAATVVPAVRIVLMAIGSTGRFLGTRDGGDVSVRAVPFVLWGPVTALLGAPLLPLLVLGGVMAFVDATKSRDTVGMVLVPLVAVLLAGVMVGNLAASAALVRRMKWAMALGGVSGIIGALLGLLGLAAAMVAAASNRHMQLSMLSVFAGSGLILAALATPSLAFAAAAIKFRFRLPDYLVPAALPPGSPAPKLMELLVPPAPPGD